MNPRIFLVLALGACAPGAEILLEENRFRVPGARDGTLVVTVAGADAPLFGESRVADDALVFESAFPLRPGITYRAVYTPSAGDAVLRTFTLPEPPPGPPARLVRIAPSADVLPENLLKFYLHFSAPMARGEAYSRLRLLDGGGTPVELPFLEIDEELWDPGGMRLTVLFDPGRIKRGLKPREEVGPALEEGKRYTLVVDPGWPDATGRPLAEGRRKAFRVAPPDDVQPDPKRWKLTPPPAGSRDPLVVMFDEPMDDAMLRRVLGVTRGGTAVPGRIEVSGKETRWTFTPEAPWTAAAHALEVHTTLEDLAGNSIEAPFEVDLFDKVDRRIPSKTLRLPFKPEP